MMKVLDVLDPSEFFFLGGQRKLPSPLSGKGACWSRSPGWLGWSGTVLSQVAVFPLQAPPSLLWPHLAISWSCHLLFDLRLINNRTAAASVEGGDPSC